VQTRSRLAQLEALRGIAALIVVAWHFLWAFEPARLGIAGGSDPSAALLGSIALAPVDGPAAVTLFFVLSGFVLPLSFFRSGRTEFVVRAAAKRWFRLVCLSLLAVLFSYLLFRFGLYRYREAANLTGSAWLGTFGGADARQAFQPSLLDALSEGSVLAFLREPDAYDPVLWTMHHEFLGSFVSYFLAIVLARARVPVAIWFLLGATVIVQFTDPWLVAFVAGTGLAWLTTRVDLRLPAVAAVGCIAIGVFLFGYLEPTGTYAPFATIHNSGSVRYDRIDTHTASGLCILLGLLGSARLGDILASPLFRELGRLSFPIYLFHFPLLCSVASGLFIALQATMPHAEALALVAIVYGGLVIAVAYVFASIDETWLAWVNLFAGKMIK
jgi:peptidoglycan/LPS O-acetylase OafA/YrhL